MLSLRDLVIDPKTLGTKLLLVDVRPAYEYQEGKRTDRIVGYRYEIVLPDKGFEKLAVEIEGPQQLDKPDGYAEVAFDGLEIYAYQQNGTIAVGARATGIRRIQTNSKS